jgi:hypothetical protein
MPRARKLTCDCLRMMRDRIRGCLGAIEASGGRLRLSERLHQSGQVRRLFVTQLDGDRGRFAFNSDVQEHLNITPCVPSVEVFHIGKNVRLNAIDLHGQGVRSQLSKEHDVTLRSIRRLLRDNFRIALLRPQIMLCHNLASAVAEGDQPVRVLGHQLFVEASSNLVPSPAPPLGGRLWCVRSSHCAPHSRATTNLAHSDVPCSSTGWRDANKRAV